MNKIVDSNEEASEFLRRILLELDSSDVKYCAQRNYEGYPQVLTGDIDLVVSEEDISSASLIINNVAKEIGWIKFQSYSWAKTVYLGFTKSIYPERFALVIELFAGARWHGLEYISAKDILNERMKVNNVWGPSPAHQALITMFHHMLYNNTVPEKYRDEIVRLVNISKMQFINSVDSVFINKCGQEFAEAIRSGRWDDVKSYISKLKLSILLKNIIFSPISTIISVFGGYRAKKTVNPGIIIFVRKYNGSAELMDSLMFIANKWHLYMPTKRKLFFSGPSQENEIFKICNSGGLAIVEGDKKDFQINNSWSYSIELNDHELYLIRDVRLNAFASQNSSDSIKQASLILNTILSDSQMRLM